MKYKCDYELIKGHDTDSGYDLKTKYAFKLLPNQVKLIPTSLFLELDKNIEAQVRPKSSISAKGILVHFGTVDSDYRGEVQVVMQNLNDYGVEFEAGQKIAQIVFNEKTEVVLEQTDTVSNDTDRGSGGFGSTGAF
jgi:dUTP diphosphatase|nr:MAG TPA: dUTPase [Caudoviricetes sp.]